VYGMQLGGQHAGYRSAGRSHEWYVDTAIYTYLIATHRYSASVCDGQTDRQIYYS